MATGVDERLVHIDSTAAKSIAERRGLDKVRHIDVNLLWIQDVVARERLPLYKVLGTSTPSELMTKHLPSAQLMTYLELLGMEFRDGRAEKGC